jgi:signal transduction histidine kinase
MPTPKTVQPTPSAADLQALLELSITALALLHPVYDSDGTAIRDFACAYLNPAGQQLLDQSERPEVTLLTRFPNARENGLFAFCSRVFESSEPGQFEGNFQVAGLDYYFYVAARRQGKQLAVSFTDTAQQSWAAVETALRESQAAEALARAEAEHQRATLVRYLGRTQAAICVLRGPAHELDYCNPTFERLFTGHSLPPGSPLIDVFPSAIAQGMVRAFDNVYHTGNSFFGVEQALSIMPGPAAQHYFTFSFDAYQEHGRTAGVSIFAYDVTEAVLARHRTEALQAELLAAARQQLEERNTFYEVFAQTPALVALLRAASHRFEYVNPAYQALFPGRQLVGLDLAVAEPEAVEQGFIDLLDHVYRTGETYFGAELPFQVASTDGPPVRPEYYNFTYQAFREAGQVAGISLFAFNVTQQVLARREREAQQLQLEELFMQAPAPITIFAGPELVYQFVNPAYQRIFPGRGLLGRPLLEALPELTGSPIPALLRHVYDTGEPYTAEEMPLQLARHEGGPLEEIYWTFSCQAHRNAYGTIDGVRAFAHDVTVSVRARQVLQEANQALTESNRQLTRTNTDLDTFIYTASHDLRTPITNLEGLLYALREELPADLLQANDVLPLLDRMQGSVDRFKLTIAQLTDLTKLQRADQQPAESVDLATLVADIRLDLAQQLTTTEAQLTVDVASCPQVSFGPQNLRSIVYNLLSNAVKYRHPDRTPVVQLRCRRAEKGPVVLEVQDNGLGLTEAQQSKLFGLFRRLHDHVEGSGVGLYMVKRVVENAGGTIAVQSTPGVGTTFILTLPVPAVVG